MRSIQSASETPRSTLRRAVQKRPDLRLAFGPDVQHVAGLERADLAEDGARRERVAEAEEIVDAVLVEVEGVVGKLAQRGDFGREGEAARLLGEEQRLDADRVAGERQALCELVPDGDREHAFEPGPGVVAPAQVSGEDGLGVAVIGLEGVAALELAPQRRMIDDLAVEDDRVAPVGAEDRLVAAFDVDDAEAAHAEAEIAVDEIAGVIGAAVAKAVAGSRDGVLRHRLAAASIPACNSAHTGLFA